MVSANMTVPSLNELIIIVDDCGGHLIFLNRGHDVCRCNRFIAP